MNKPENRVDKIVSDLLHGRRLRLRGGDAEEKAAITAAARLAAARQGPHRMNPAFRKRLEQALESAPKEPWMTRRAALVAGFGLAATAVAGGLVGRALEPTATGQARIGGGPIDPIGGRWVDVAAMSDLVEGQGKRVTAGGVGAFLFRRGGRHSHTHLHLSKKTSLPGRISTTRPQARTRAMLLAMFFPGSRRAKVTISAFDDEFRR